MSSPKVKKALCGLLRDPGNSHCADCKNASHPRWASWSLGVFVCIKCAGVHRSLGTHISKVKSVDLDIWKEEHLEVLIQMGSNAQANRRYEARLPESLRRPIVDSGKLQSFIRSKYEGRKWVGIPEERVAAPAADAERASSSEKSQSCQDELVSMGQSDSSSVLNLQLLSMPRARESSSASSLVVGDASGASGASSISTSAAGRRPSAVRSDRPDLKKSILSLYAKPQTPLETPLETPLPQTHTPVPTPVHTPVHTPAPQLHQQPPLQSLEDNELFKNVWT